MRKTEFGLLVKSIKQADRIRRGKLKASRSFEFPPADIRGIRLTLERTQAEFALMLGVSVATLRNWEARSSNAARSSASDSQGGCGEPAGGRPGSERMTRSNGNVFRDLGFPSREAENLKIRSALIGHIRRLIKSRAGAAKAMRLSQTRLRDLARGEIDLISIESLVTMLGRLGATVRVEVTPRRRKAPVA